jgi:hypothetical protein
MGRYVTDGVIMEIARQKARAILSTFGDGDEVALIPLCESRSNRPERLLTTANAATEDLERLSAAYQSADLGAGLDQAFSLLRNAANFNRELYIVSDRQLYGLPSAESSKDRTDLPEGLRAYLVDLPLNGQDNIGITGIDLGGRLLLPGHPFDMTATIEGYGTSLRNELIASLFVDGNRVTQEEVPLEVGQRASVRFTHTVLRTGFHSGHVEIPDDRLAADNRYYFSFHIPDQFNVLIVSVDPSGQLLKLALVPSPDLGQYWSIKEAGPLDLSGVDFQDYDAIVLAGAPSLPETAAERLRAFVSRGGSVFVTYSSTTDPGYFNREWAPLAGVSIERPVKAAVSRAGFFTLASVVQEHPVFAPFEFSAERLPELRFYDLPTIRIDDSSAVLMRLSGNRPGLVENRVGRGKVMTLTAPIEPAYSDIAGHAFFVPLVSRVLEYLTAELSQFEADLRIGQALTRAPQLGGAIELPPILVTPDSVEYSLAVDADPNGTVLRPEPTDLPGVYQINYLGREIDRFALNMDPAEGNLAAVDPGQLTAVTGIPDLQVIAGDATMASVIDQLRHGRELWQLFLWLALGLLVVEMLVARASSAEADH